MAPAVAVSLFQHPPFYMAEALHSTETSSWRAFCQNCSQARPAVRQCPHCSFIYCFQCSTGVIYCFNCNMEVDCWDIITRPTDPVWHPLPEKTTHWRIPQAGPRPTPALQLPVLTSTPIPVQLPTPLPIQLPFPIHPAQLGPVPVQMRLPSPPGVNLHELQQRVMELQLEMYRKDRAIQFLDSKCAELISQHHRENLCLRTRMASLEDKIKQLQKPNSQDTEGQVEIPELAVNK